MKHVAECPGCGAEYFTTVADAQAGLWCSACSLQFTPETLKQIEDVPAPLPQVEPLPPARQKTSREEQSRRARLQERQDLTSKGDTMGVVAIIFFVVAGVCLVLIFTARQGEEWILASVAGGCFFLALWCVLFSHLNHIRAALVKVEG